MKKLLILTAAMLVVGASLASAAGMNLSWNKCTTGGTAPGLNYTNLNDGAQGMKQFQGSAKVDVAILDFASQTAVVDMGFDSAVPSFWATVLSGCNVGALTVQAPSNSNVTVGGNTTTCNVANLFATNSAGGFGVTFPSPNRMRLTVDYATGNAGIVANANQLYGMFALQMDMDTEINVGCLGATVPACIVLNSEEVNGFNQPAEKYLVETTDVRSYITYNGGSSNCPGATPSHNNTWGQVKALYR